MYNEETQLCNLLCFLQKSAIITKKRQHRSIIITASPYVYSYTFRQELFRTYIFRALLPPCSAMSDGLHYQTWCLEGKGSSSSTPLPNPSFHARMPGCNIHFTPHSKTAERNIQHWNPVPIKKLLHFNKKPQQHWNNQLTILASLLLLCPNTNLLLCPTNAASNSTSKSPKLLLL